MKWFKKWQCNRLIKKHHSFKDDHLDVAMLKWIIKEFNLKDNTKVFVERIYDNDTNMDIVEKDNCHYHSGKMKYMRLFGYTIYCNDDNLYLMVHS